MQTAEAAAPGVWTRPPSSRLLGAARRRVPEEGGAAPGVDKIAHHDQTGSLQVFSREGRTPEPSTLFFEKRNEKDHKQKRPADPELNEF